MQNSPRQAHRCRHGVVLILVLVIVATLSFAVYSFTNRTVLEYSANRMALRQIQRRELAESAIELARLEMDSRTETRDGIFPGELLVEDGTVGGFTVLQRIPDHGQPPTQGLWDESAKLNLNTLPLEDLKRDESRRRLMSLPRMTHQTADAILDWMDADDEPSQFGAESSWYTAQKRPQLPRQDRFRSLQELLLVKGITSELLMGEDANGNGLLDPNEDDGDRSFPPDNADGLLFPGWSKDLTLVSCETAWRSNGQRKINLNHANLAELYDLLVGGFGRDMARYVIAARMAGVSYSDQTEAETESEEQLLQERRESAEKRLQAQLGLTDPAKALSRKDSMRDGIRLSATPPYQIKSVVGLFGGTVRITIDNEDTILNAPWQSDPTTIARLLPLAEQLLTTTDRDTLNGRVNINQASEDVLMTIPEMTQAMARNIVTVRTGTTHLQQSGHDSVAWLVLRGVMSVAKLRQLSPYITSGGSIRTGVAVGWYAQDPPVAAIQFTLDASSGRSLLSRVRDLDVLTQTQCGLTQTTSFNDIR